ncbi:MAG TPA: TolC family protein [Geomonas sp.]|nr:TolC family protein [Geomonas sp.]
MKRVSMVIGSVVSRAGGSLSPSLQGGAGGWLRSAGVAALATLLLTATPPPVIAEEALTLKECVTRAVVHAPEMGEAQADVELMSAKLSEAKGYRLPQVDFLGLTGPIPQARGNQIYSPDSINSTDRWTWYTKGDLMAVQPIYSFGKISHAMSAATHGIEVEKARKEQKRNEVVVKVKEYYYDVLLARELKNLLAEVRDDLTQAKDKAKKLLDQNSSNVEEADLYKLDAFGGEVDKYLAEAEKGERLALSALKVKVGVPPDGKLELADARLSKVDQPIGPLDAYVARAQAGRPEFRQVKEGLKAREQLVAGARAARYPDFFVGAIVSGAWSPGRDRINNPWVPDDYNHFWAGAALGLKWKLDFGITSAKVSQEQAQYDRLLSTRQFADENIPLEITKFYDEGLEASKGIEATRTGYESSKKWAVTALANFDFGIGPAKEIFDSLQQYAKMRAAYFQAIFNYNMALANLSYATGEWE